MPKHGSFSDLKKQERENRRQFILDVAVKLFAETPFNQVTMRNIADAAGITAAAIYRYFPEKYDLFAEAYIQLGDVFIQEMKNLIAGRDDTCLTTIARKYIHNFYGAGRPLNIMVQFMLDDSISGALWEKFNQVNRLFTAQIELFFKQMNPDVDEKIAAQSFIAALNGVLITAKNYPGKSEEEILSHMERLGALIAELFQERMRPENG